MPKDNVEAIVENLGNKARKIMNNENFSWQDEGSERPMYSVVKVGIGFGKGENS